MRGRGGFSVVELLVVIGVVALLVAITIPVLGRARDSARRARCLAQVRDLAIGVETFTGSRGGKLPENRTLLNDREYITWRAQLRGEGSIGEAEAWVCPSHKGSGPKSELGFVDDGAVCVDDVRSSYAINGHVLWRRDSVDDDAVRRVGVIARPSHTILIAETNRANADLRVSPPLLANYYGDDPGAYGYWHEGAAGVYGFLDGHAEVLGLLETGNPDCRWHSGRDLSADPFVPQRAEEVRAHDHPDWEFLVPEVYLGGA